MRQESREEGRIWLNVRRSLVVIICNLRDFNFLFPDLSVNVLITGIKPGIGDFNRFGLVGKDGCFRHAIHVLAKDNSDR